MYEQDIQLARLLIGKLDEMSSRQEDLIAQLKLVQAELIESQKVREERSSYEDVLARAAELLARPDLRMASPEINDLQEQADSLQIEVGEIEGAMAEYRKLVDELRHRAPNLVEAAFAEQQDGGGGPVTTDSTEPALEVAEVEAEVEPETATDEAAADAGEEAPAADPAPTETGDEAEVDEDDTRQLDQLFAIKELKTKETYTFGRNAAFILDATSVLERVPQYDLHFRALSEPEARDQLISDIDGLSRSLSGDFYLVFNSWHQPQVDFSNKVDLRNVFGEDEGVKMAANDMIRELAGELVARERVVCVVTGDSGLAASVGGQGVHIIPLSEFFNS